MRNPSAVILLVLAAAALFVYLLLQTKQSPNEEKEGGETVTSQIAHNFNQFDTYVRPKFSPISVNQMMHSKSR